MGVESGPVFATTPTQFLTIVLTRQTGGDSLAPAARLLQLWALAQGREEDHVADGLAPGQDHCEAVDP
jgi:hypothetical protein